MQNELEHYEIFSPTDVRLVKPSLMKKIQEWNLIAQAKAFDADVVAYPAPEYDSLMPI